MSDEAVECILKDDVPDWYTSGRVKQLVAREELQQRYLIRAITQAHALRLKALQKVIDGNETESAGASAAGGVAGSGSNSGQTLRPTVAWPVHRRVHAS